MAMYDIVGLVLNSYVRRQIIILRTYIGVANRHGGAPIVRAQSQTWPRLLRVGKKDPPSLILVGLSVDDFRIQYW